MGRGNVGAKVMLGAYSAVYRAACSGAYPAVRAGILGADWRWEERMGHYPPLSGSEREPRVWIHAASVGEVKAAAALIEALRDRVPNARLVVSAITPAGLETARASIPSAEAVVQAPVDLRGPVKRALNWFDPSLFILVETEIWPNTILECRRRGTPVAIASAKVSSRSFRRYRYVLPLMRHVLSGVSCVGAQTELDRDRLCRLGLSPDGVAVTGDVKMDAPGPDHDHGAPEWLSKVRGPEDFLFAAGSTRPGEEEIVAKALLAAGREVKKSVVSVIAPRHIERCSEVSRRLTELGMNVALKSGFSPEGWRERPGPRALILDSIGELARVYPSCDVAFVGGTLAPHGGHNLAEAAAAGVPVLFGTSIESVRTVAEALVRDGGGVMVTGPESMANEIAGLLLDPEERRRRATAASTAVEALRGAAGRTLDLFERRGVLKPSER